MSGAGGDGRAEGALGGRGGRGTEGPRSAGGAHGGQGTKRPWSVEGVEGVHGGQRARGAHDTEGADRGPVPDGADLAGSAGAHRASGGPPGAQLPDGLRAGGRFDAWRPAVPAYVVADVDGTLLARGTTATPAVAAAVVEAQAAGLRVGFATGRLPVGVRALEGQLRLAGPHIVHNGAQLHQAGRAIRTWPIDRDAVHGLVAFCAAERLYAEFFTETGFLATDRREAARPTWEQISGEPDGLVGEVDLEAVDIIKATVVAFAPAELPVILQGAERLGLKGEAAPSPLVPGASFVNVNRPGVDKGSALRAAAEELGIGLDEVVAVGDGFNDLSMLAVAGTAIAMGQAPADVQRAAHVVVPEVEADGVAHALRAAVGWRGANAVRA